MKSKNVKVKRVNVNSILPTYGSEEAACFDIYACLEGWSVTLNAKEPVLIPTGLIFEVPPGYSMRIHPRSGMAFKNGVVLANQEGVIDSDYRGELMIALILDRPEGEEFTIYQGERIAQGEIVKTGPKCQFQEVEELSESARGAGGFGSTGN